MWLLSKTWNNRPSELLHIADPLAAFYLDRAVMTFGRSVESAMDEASEGSKNSKESKRKRQMALAKYMRLGDGSHAPGTFRDPSARAR